MRQKQIIKWLVKQDAIRKGHFVLSSGRHTDTFVGITEISLNPFFLDKLVNLLTRNLSDLKVDIVAAPALSGIFLVV